MVDKTFTKLQFDEMTYRQFKGGLKGRLHETAQISQIFAVRPNLPGCPSDFCKHRPIDITLHKIGWRDRKTPISKLVGEPGRFGQTTWQNQLDLTKIGSATVRVNGT